MSTASNNKIININPPNPIWHIGAYRTRAHHLSIFAKKEKEDFITYIDFLFQVFEIDMCFEKWREMSESERISLLREIKLKKIIRENEQKSLP